MLSSIIMATAFGIGDTINYSIRTEAVESLGPIDEIVVSNRATSQDSFGASPYFPMARYDELQAELTGFDAVDGLAPGIGQNLPAVNPRTSRSEGDLRVVGVNLATVDSLGALALTSGEVALTGGPGRWRSVPERSRRRGTGGGARETRSSSSAPTGLPPSPWPGSWRGAASPDATRPSSCRWNGPRPLFDRPGEINSIVVSNRGGIVSGVDRSEEVTEWLRVYFADRDVASQLQALLSQEEALQALSAREAALDESALQEWQEFRTELAGDGANDRLVSLLADSDVSDAVLAALGAEGLQETPARGRHAVRRPGRVPGAGHQAKHPGGRGAGQQLRHHLLHHPWPLLHYGGRAAHLPDLRDAGRSPALGDGHGPGGGRQAAAPGPRCSSSRARPTPVVAAAIGVAIGLAVSALIITLVNQAIGVAEADFSFTQHFEPRSIVVAYCLGIAITMATVAVSAYRVSRLNIVAAIRDTPTPISLTTRSWRDLLTAPLRALGRPFVLGGRALRALARARVAQAAGHLVQMLWAVASIPVVFYSSVSQALWRPFTDGWLAFLLGVVVAWQGIELDQAAPFTIGVSLAVVGVGLMIRTLLKRRNMRAEVPGPHRLHLHGPGLAGLLAAAPSTRWRT